MSEQSADDCLMIATLYENVPKRMNEEKQMLLNTDNSHGIKQGKP